MAKTRRNAEQIQTAVLSYLTMNPGMKSTLTIAKAIGSTFKTALRACNDLVTLKLVSKGSSGKFFVPSKVDVRPPPARIKKIVSSISNPEMRDFASNAVLNMFKGERVEGKPLSSMNANAFYGKLDHVSKYPTSMYEAWPILTFIDTLREAVKQDILTLDEACAKLVTRFRKSVTNDKA